MDWKSLQRSLVRLQARLQHAWRHGAASIEERSGPLRARVRQAIAPVGARVRQGTARAVAALSAEHAPPPGVQRLVENWHRAECWVAVAAFAFIAGIMILDVLGREFLGPALRLIGFEPGATGIFASQKLSIFALVIGSFAGIGIATATGAHIVPSFAAGWVPAHWQRVYDRGVDLLTGVFLVAVTYYAFKFVGSSMRTDLRAPVLDWRVWPIQLAIPLGFLSAAGRYLLYAAWPALRPKPPEFKE
jgi:TRAP-type C4-dicarboxylate transport system permease small subunit